MTPALDLFPLRLYTINFKVVEELFSSYIEQLILYNREQLKENANADWLFLKYDIWWNNNWLHTTFTCLKSITEGKLGLLNPLIHFLRRFSFIPVSPTDRNNSEDHLFILMIKSGPSEFDQAP